MPLVDGTCEVAASEDDSHLAGAINKRAGASIKLIHLDHCGAMGSTLMRNCLVQESKAFQGMSVTIYVAVLMCICCSKHHLLQHIRDQLCELASCSSWDAAG